LRKKENYNLRNFNTKKIEAGDKKEKKNREIVDVFSRLM